MTSFCLHTHKINKFRIKTTTLSNTGVNALNGEQRGGREPQIPPNDARKQTYNSYPLGACLFLIAQGWRNHYIKTLYIIRPQCLRDIAANEPGTHTYTQTHTAETPILPAAGMNPDRTLL